MVPAPAVVVVGLRTGGVDGEADGALVHAVIDGRSIEGFCQIVPNEEAHRAKGEHLVTGPLVFLETKAPAMYAAVGTVHDRDPHVRLGHLRGVDDGGQLVLRLGGDVESK